MPQSQRSKSLKSRFPSVISQSPIFILYSNSVTSQAELQTLHPFIARFSRIKSIRIEFPRTQNVDEESFIQLYKGIYKCYFLKSMEWKDVG